MEKRQRFVLGFAVLAMVGLVASLGIVSAYRGDSLVQGPNCDEERHDLMAQAFDDLDYDAWKLLMEGKARSGRVLHVVNEENFPLFVQAHEAALNGDTELSAQLRSQLGLNNGVGPRDGTGHKGQGLGEHKGQGRGMGGGQGLRHAR